MEGKCNQTSRKQGKSKDKPLACCLFLVETVNQQPADLHTG